jgi:RHS repeat-associated protein
LRVAHADPAAGSNNSTRIKTNLNYDPANRLLQVYKTINDADSTNRLIAQQAYDQMGQLKQKQLGQLPGEETFLETQDYSYNIRGWLQGINKDYANNDNSHGGNTRWFGMELNYDWGFTHNQLNGNIAGTKWRSRGDGQQRAYGFGYDNVNRLLFADFNQYTGSNWDKTAGIDFTSVMGNGMDPNTAYDENGNIKAMLQSGWQLGGSHPIDSLNYTYYSNSNKLQNVIDGRNDPLTTLGDFRTSSLSPYSTGKTDTAVDYVYDPNGNMTRDLNKDIGSQTTDGIIYNHLNLPWQVKVRSATGTKGTITYIYDATGNKLKKTTLDSAAGIQTVTTYIGAFQYQGRQAVGSTSAAIDTLQFFGQEEGRVRVSNDTTGGGSRTAFKYDYFLKDHLGNTRMVLTDEQQTDRYPAATMEVGDSATENLYYSKLDSVRVGLPAGYPTDTTTNPNNYVALLDGSSHKIGPGITLKVMAGDQFSIRVSSWYRLNGTSPGAPVNPLPDLLGALISGVGGLPGGHPTPAVLQGNSAPLSINVNQFLSDTGSAIVQTKPHAFVNWVLFDNQFNYVAASSGFDQVGGDQELKKHCLTNLPITTCGYLYIYASNETPNINVFFDNLQVTHTRGPLLEEDHYYPFGLTMAGISDKALKINYAENKVRFQKQELQNKEFSDGSGLEMYEFKYRMDDPQIGRFCSIDPLADKYVYNSTYAFSEDKVTGHIELEGLESIPFGTAMFRDAGISSSSDPKKFVADVGKEALKPQTWAVGYAIAGGLIGGPALVGIMTGGMGEGAMVEAEVSAARTSLALTAPESSGVNLADRANDIHSSLGPGKTFDRTVVATASVTNADGTPGILVGSSEPNLRPVQRAALQPGETPVSGTGHAETTVLDHAAANGMTVHAVAASRPICANCAAAISNAGAVPASPLKIPIPGPAVDATFQRLPVIKLPNQ